MTLGESNGPMSRGSVEGKVGLRDFSEVLEMPLWDVGWCVCVCMCVCGCLERWEGEGSKAGSYILRCTEGGQNFPVVPAEQSPF